MIDPLVTIIQTDQELWKFGETHIEASGAFASPEDIEHLRSCAGDKATQEYLTRVAS